MRILAACWLVLGLAHLCCWAEDEADRRSVRLAPSQFRLIREVDFEGRDLFELAIKAGMYSRKGNEYLPGAERGAVSAGGRTWHGSNGVGLVAYDPGMKRYYVYYFQEQAIPGHHLDIIHADDEFIFFSYGYHKDWPDVRGSLEVYSLKFNRFARVEAVSTTGGKFGAFLWDVLKKENPLGIPPQMGWDERNLAGRDWADLSESRLFRPDRIVDEGGVFRFSYHLGWKIDEFTTALQFRKNDLIKEFERLSPKKTVGGERH